MASQPSPLHAVLTPAVLAVAVGAPVAAWAVRPGTYAALDQSDAAVLDVEHAAGDGGGGDGGGGVTTLFVKTMQAARLKARLGKDDEDWSANARSWRNECAFYRRAPQAALRACGVRLPRAHAAWAGGGGDSGDAASAADDDGDLERASFTFLLEYLPPERYAQPRVLSVAQAGAALAALARFHAYFWQPPPAAIDGGERHDAASASAAPSPRSPLDALLQPSSDRDDGGGGGGVFPHGCWWRRARQRKVDVAAAPAVFARLCADFRAEFDARGLDTPANHALMGWLAAHAPAIGDALQRAPRATLVHGDAKAANMMFRTSAGGGGKGEGEGDDAEVCLFDFQWVGGGASGAGDVVYCVAGSVDPCELLRTSALDGDGDSDGGGGSGTVEAALLAGYHGALTAALRDRHGAAAADAYSAAAFAADYRAEWLDYAATALPYLLASVRPGDLAANAAKHGWLTHEWDARCVAWFVARTLHHAAALRAQWAQAAAPAPAE
jgi:hypothetical protein